MSDDEGTEWAECCVCGLSTDPRANLPGDRDPREVEVRGEPGNSGSGMSGVSRTERRRVSTSGCRPVVMPDGGKGDEWLARNARHVGTSQWPEAKGTGSWERATTSGRRADYGSEEGLGRFWVRYPDGDIHQVLLVKDGEEYAGACGCESFQYETNRPCAHLCVLRIEDSEMGSDNFSVPSSHEYVRELIAVSDGAQSDESEAVTQAHPEQQNSATAVPEPDTGASEVPQEPAQTDDAFASPLPDVEDKFVIDMDGSKYIRKAGYARLLSQQGWTVETDEVVGAHETEWKRAKYRATIFDPETGRALSTSVGTAGPPEKEDMADADMHLDELAETRAWTRAASIATGEGMTALAEIPEHSGEEVNTNV